MCVQCLGSLEAEAFHQSSVGVVQVLELPGHVVSVLSAPRGVWDFGGMSKCLRFLGTQRSLLELFRLSLYRCKTRQKYMISGTSLTTIINIPVQCILFIPIKFSTFGSIKCFGCSYHSIQRTPKNILCTAQIIQ